MHSNQQSKLEEFITEKRDSCNCGKHDKRDGNPSREGGLLRIECKHHNPSVCSGYGKTNSFSFET